MGKAAFVVGSPKGDLGHLGDLLPKEGLLKVTFLFESLLSERKHDTGTCSTHLKIIYLRNLNDVISNLEILHFILKELPPL